MDYELAKKLKEAGYPQLVRISQNFYPYPDSNERTNTDEDHDIDCSTDDDCVKSPRLSELIEACGNRFESLDFFPTRPKKSIRWRATGMCNAITKEAETPEEAVAKLYIELNT